MATRILPDAKADLGRAAQHYRSIPPPAVGKQLAGRLIAAFRDAVGTAVLLGATRAQHPDIPLGHFVTFSGYPYLLFYTVKGDDLFVISVEFSTSDYLDRVTKRMASLP